ncbi:DUF2742 domain-containing protein [Mycobacterium marinum]|uniref:DUF2742 domain-containing protein n=1 Tax=Mycobacterium marinum TaxID=1781 RepID=UPI0035664C68
MNQQRESRPAGNGTANHSDTYSISGRAVSWWEVHTHVAPVLAAAGSWPMVGTPAWCQLDDTDPAKLAAVRDAAQHWALRVETCQQAMAAASHEVSAADDWGAVARSARRHADAVRSGAYIPREVVR